MRPIVCAKGRLSNPIGGGLIRDTILADSAVGTQTRNTDGMLYFVSNKMRSSETAYRDRLRA